MMAQLARRSRAAALRAARQPGCGRGASAEAARASAGGHAVERAGEFGTPEWRAYLTCNGSRVSAWHDVPLLAADGPPRLLSFVNEIPRGSTPKLEVATKEHANPVAQDTKKGKLREYPFAINWNYGLIPQTFEDPALSHPGANVLGDDDPVDALEISGAARATGAVLPVKVVGALALVDDGELDWKILTLAAEDERASRINGPKELEQEMPGEIARVHEWFRDYKKPDGKPENEFLYNGECTSAEYAQKVIDESHEAWRRLFNGERSNDDLGHSLWAANSNPQTTASSAAAA
jgi:inorganic pyrophosphatase